MLANIKVFLLGFITLTVEGTIMHFNLFFKVFALILLSPLYFTPEQVALLANTHGVYMIADTAVTAWIATAFEISLLLVMSATISVRVLRSKIIKIEKHNRTIEKMN